MRVLIVGSGGREHAIAWKLASSEHVTHLCAMPGNAGIGSIARRVAGCDATDIQAIADYAERERVDLTVVGPETPLIAGIVDEFERRGLKAFGPSKEAAKMEGSKAFAKQLMAESGVPTAGFEVFEDSDKAADYVRGLRETPIVVKADGEAAGKGVYVCRTQAEALEAIDAIMKQRLFGESGNRVVIEEFLDGQEATFMLFVNGETFVPMVASQDYKRAFDGDEGPNTGGMGCYSPVPVFTDEVRETVIETIVRPTLKALASRGILYRGILYCGLALTSSGPKVVEFNSRFGDPETQVVLPLLDSDLLEICLAVAEDRLANVDVRWSSKKAVCVVMASGGYPGSYDKGKDILGLEEASGNGIIVFHAGTQARGDRILTSGGRVLGVTAVGDSFKDCISSAYAGVSKIHFEDAHYRHDIGARLL